MEADKVAQAFLFLEKTVIERIRNSRTMISNLRLQKLLYFAQGLHIQRTGERLFEEEMEAWKFGPVVRTVYQKYNSCGFLPIAGIRSLPSFHIKDLPSDWSDFNFTEEQSASIIATFEKLYKLTTIELTEISHRSTPWREAWYSGNFVKVENIFNENKEESEHADN